MRSLRYTHFSLHHLQLPRTLSNNMHRVPIVLILSLAATFVLCPPVEDFWHELLDLTADEQAQQRFVQTAHLPSDVGASNQSPTTHARPLDGHQSSSIIAESESGHWIPHPQRDAWTDAMANYHSSLAAGSQTFPIFDTSEAHADGMEIPTTIMFPTYRPEHWRRVEQRWLELPVEAPTPLSLTERRAILADAELYFTANRGPPTMHPFDGQGLTEGIMREYTQTANNLRQYKPNHFVMVRSEALSNGFTPGEGGMSPRSEKQYHLFVFKRTQDSNQPRTTLQLVGLLDTPSRTKHTVKGLPRFLSDRVRPRAIGPDSFVVDSELRLFLP